MYIEIEESNANAVLTLELIQFCSEPLKYVFIDRNKKGRDKRKATSDLLRLWTDNVVPYTIAKGLLSK